MIKVLSDERINEIDIECGVHEIDNGKPNPPKYYEHQLLEDQLLKAQQHYEKAINEAYHKGYKLACDQLSKHYRKQIEGMVKLAAKGSPEYEKLREDIKVELKTFGCQWDLIGEEDPEDIASESADSILSLLKGGK